MNKVISGVIGIAAIAIIAAFVFVSTDADYVSVESPLGGVDIGKNTASKESSVVYNIENVNINELDDLNVEQLKDLRDKVSATSQDRESEEITTEIKNTISEKESIPTPKQNYQSLRNISGEVWNYSGYANLASDNGQIIFYDDGTFAMEGFFDGSPYSVSGEFYVDFNNGIFMISSSEMGTMTYYITSTSQNSFSISNPLFNTYYDLALN